MSSTEPGIATPLPEPLRAGLVGLGLVGADEMVLGEPVSGGVSSDVWRADLRDGPVCVKQALHQLRVEATWRVSTERSAFEADWFAVVDELVPGCACPLIGFDAPTRVLVLAWLDSAASPVWKQDLLRGQVRPDIAQLLGDRVGQIHAALADPNRFAERFRANELFRALRLDPYFTVTAKRRPEHADALLALRDRTARSARTVIHGDVSPKNVLLTGEGPVLIDAECASWGDPAFDVAFCLNHLLLKTVLLPHIADQLRVAFDAFVAAYRARITWEPAEALEARAATLLPALSLARVDGASPVEYLTEQSGRPLVRGLVAPLLSTSPATLAAVADHWFSQLSTADHSPERSVVE